MTARSDYIRRMAELTRLFVASAGHDNVEFAQAMRTTVKAAADAAELVRVASIIEKPLRGRWLREVLMTRSTIVGYFVYAMLTDERNPLLEEIQHAQPAQPALCYRN